ncbi:hypothetical protein PISMIDRAFT_680671 [Pisolithus microcarpus 441]|uniref:Uncharacterized protein n=1 Tax=Pisolithus microcarpus 441 TaxID=765257 RepID=A0A0C9ZI01_9AGAM|nr:hypothetical protein PISMIDRAFT_680671 [Pisolithus microcarpus 441]
MTTPTWETEGVGYNRRKRSIEGLQAKIKSVYGEFVTRMCCTYINDMASHPIPQLPASSVLFIPLSACTSTHTTAMFMTDPPT